MAKRSKPRTTLLANDRERRMEWVSSKGVRVILKGVPPLLLTSIPDSVDIPEKPHYSVTTASGSVEVYDHDETTLVTDEDKAAWAKYKEELDAVETELVEITLKTILYEGVEIPDVDQQMSSWRKMMKLTKRRIPEDPDEALLLFKESAVVGDEIDMNFIMDNVLRLTGVSKQQIEAASRTFPDTVEPESPGTNGDSPEQPSDQEG